jgi:hypothetical protein
MEFLNGHKLTVGVLFGLLGLAGTVAGIALGARAQAEGISEAVVRRHEQRDLEQAHPASKRIEDKLDKIDRRLDEARETLKRIEGQLSK